MRFNLLHPLPITLLQLLNELTFQGHKQIKHKPYHTLLNCRLYFHFGDVYSLDIKGWSDDYTLPGSNSISYHNIVKQSKCDAIRELL